MNIISILLGKIRKTFVKNAGRGLPASPESQKILEDMITEMWGTTVFSKEAQKLSPETAAREAQERLVLPADKETTKTTPKGERAWMWERFRRLEGRKKQFYILLLVAGWVSLTGLVICFLSFAPDMASSTYEAPPPPEPPPPPDVFGSVAGASSNFLNAFFGFCAHSPFHALVLLSLPAVLFGAVLFWWFRGERPNQASEHSEQYAGHWR